MPKGTANPTETATETEPETGLSTITLHGPLAEVAAIIQSIPPADDDPTARMVAYIMAAPPEDWAALWEKLPNVKDNAGRSFEVHDLRIAESDFKSQLGVYLICDVTWLDTGETGLLSVSSQISMVQLLRLYKDRRFPAKLQIVAKAKATKAGFHPIHLAYLDPTNVATGDPTKIVSEQ